jgi:hypothetical protein
MVTDIRRMSREDLDRLNAESKAWRERNKTRPGPDTGAAGAGCDPDDTT